MIAIFLHVRKCGNVFMNFPIILFKLHNKIENISASCHCVNPLPVFPGCICQLSAYRRIVNIKSGGLTFG